MKTRAGQPKKAVNLVTLRAKEWQEHNRDLYNFLVMTRDLSELSGSFLQSLERFGSLSPAEYERAVRMKDRAEAKANEGPTTLHHRNQQ